VLSLFSSEPPAPGLPDPFIPKTFSGSRFELVIGLARIRYTSWTLVLLMLVVPTEFPAFL
jgi:hypothetical protein